MAGEQETEQEQRVPLRGTTIHRMMAAGHRLRTGHDLDGYLAPSPTAGVLVIVKTCCQGSGAGESQAEGA
jgi:hypothetical protein